MRRLVTRKTTMRQLVVSTAALAVLCAAGSCLAEVEVGAEAPAFSDLKGVDGETHSLADYEDAKAVVAIFTCNHCPVAKAYEDRIIELQSDYGDKGVQVVAINPNSPKKQPQDGYEQMKTRAKEKEFNFPYLVDATQEVARSYGATRTPHVFILDGEREVAYIGAIDDNMNASKVEKQYVRDALDAILAGNDPDPASTNAVGCTIKWE